ncbi:MAG: diacylglycerol kinase family lipid kinase [Bacteroidetes bacterium]|nr:diacylglycerol kinase family lipid kinase [Bacteroidota bacterium]
MPRKILFIVNPNAGKQISSLIVETIRSEFPQNIYYHIAIWKNKSHFKDILEALRNGDYTDAVAVGGDGTVNQVAKSILGSGITLGIIPTGSGNGLARSLGLSMDVEEVIKQIAVGKTILIDNGSVNGIPFFCTSGVGFDAHIGNLFATSKKRGLKSYVKIVLREVFKYRAKNYILKFNDTEIKRKAFLITVANAGQYGNNLYIAPQADMRDGFFHVSVLRPFTIFHVPGLMFKVFRRKAHTSSLIETLVTNKLSIIRDDKDTMHFDGEPTVAEKEVIFECMPGSLKVIVGEGFKA